MPCCCQVTSKTNDGQRTRLHSCSAPTSSKFATLFRNIRDLEKLDLGGQLELSHLENVTVADAKAAKLGDKRKLEELELSWELDTTDRDKEENEKVLDDGLEPHEREAMRMDMYEKVLDGLKPHDGIKAMRMTCYAGRAFATWMLELQGMVELNLLGCDNVTMLPALWKLPALQFLSLCSLYNLDCLFSGGPPSNSFQKLESIVLESMPKFKRWWDTNEVQGEEPIFPKVEYLRIWYCKSLEALPPSSRDNTKRCRPAFPVLRKMNLRKLDEFHRWEAVEEEQVTFPSLEDLEITDCPKVIAFPEAPKLSKLDISCSCSQQAPLQAASRYISSLSSMKVFFSSDAKNIEGQDWKEVEVCGHKSPMDVLYLRECHFFIRQSPPALWKCFGELACLEICKCNDLDFWPEHLFEYLVSLRTLEIRECPNLTGLTTKEEASVEQFAAPEQSSGTLLPSLESLKIICCTSLEQVPNLRVGRLKTLYIFEGSDRLRSMVFREQEDCKRLVSGEGDIQPADSCYVPCLESLSIILCRGLTKVANLPRSIKTLEIDTCDSLVSLSGEVSSLKELSFKFCDSLEDLPNGPYSSLRVLKIIFCDCESITTKLLQVTMTPEQGESSMSMSDREHQEQVELESKKESTSDGASTAVELLKQSSSTSSNHCVFPCLESLTIRGCDILTNVANLPRSIKTLALWSCKKLESLSAEVPLLEELNISGCEILESLPNGPAHQEYLSLRVLKITSCSGIKQLPPSLQRRLDYLEKKDLDPHLLQDISGPAEPVPTGRIAALMSKLACFKSRRVRKLDQDFSSEAVV